MLRPIAHRPIPYYPENAMATRAYDDDRSAALALLRQHPTLLPLVREACHRLRAAFGPNVRLRLELDVDREARNQRSLVLVAYTTLDPPDARERLQEFDRTWWLSAQSASGGLLSVDVSYTRGA